MLSWTAFALLNARWVKAHPEVDSAQWTNWLGVATGLQVGAPADVVELDPTHPALIARDGDALLDSWVFAARNGAVRSVWRQGRQLVHQGRHLQRDAVAARFARALQTLLSAG